MNSTDPTEGAPVVPDGASGQDQKVGRSDTPLTEAEVTQRGIRNFSLERFPITPVAHDSLKERGMDPRQPYWQRFWAGLRNRAAEAGRQLTRAETDALFNEYNGVVAEERADHDALYDAKLDTSTPEGGADFTCELPGEVGCDVKVTPNAWNLVVGGRVMTHRAGPKQGQPIRRGVYVLYVDPTDGTQVKGLCRKHLKEVTRDRAMAGMDGKSLTYEDAIRIATRIDGDLEGRRDMLKGALPRPQRGRTPHDERVARDFGIATGRVLPESATPPPTQVGNLRVEADQRAKRDSQR